MKFKKHIKQRLIGTAMAVGLSASCALPVMAQEVTFHDWATSTLLQGEKYGIYPIGWYENMQAEMDHQTLMTFCEAIGNELTQISGVALKADAKEITIPEAKSCTREQVLESIYAVIQQYTYPTNIDWGNDAISYMKDKQIILGTGKDLHLDKACTLEEAAIFGTRLVKSFYEDLNAGSKGLLWKMEKNGNTVYMLGSVHVANYDVYPLHESLLEAYESADVLGVEVNLYDQKGIEEFMALSVYTDGTTLKDHISEELYTKVVAAAKKLGLTEADIAPYKPWSLTNTFTTAVSSNASSVEEQQLSTLLGIDNYFMTDALMDGMPIYELEGYAYQGGLFDGFSPALQEKNLREMADAMLNEESNETGEIVDNWLKYWQEGDVQAFETSFPKGIAPDAEVSEEDKVLLEEYYNKLLTVRDIEMTDKIEALLNGDEAKTYFIVVGAGHYIGEDGVIQNLKDKGYTVTQVE